MGLLVWAFILLGLFSLLTVLALFVYIYPRYRKRKQAWERIKENFGFKEENSYKLKGEWRDETIAIEYHPGSRYKRASISVSLDCSFENIPGGTLLAERWWDKLGKKTGLAKEFQSLSDQFNESIYVESDDRGFRKLIRSSTFRRITTSLIENRHTKVRINRGPFNRGLVWHSRVYHGFWKQLASVPFLVDILGNLIDLKVHLHKRDNQISPAAQERENGKRHTSPIITGIGFGIPVGTPILGFILFFWGTYFPTFTSQLHWIGLKIAGVAFLLYLPIGYICFRGSSKAHKEFLTFTVCALFGLPLFTVGSLTTVNGLMDTDSSAWRLGHPIDLRYDEGEYFVTVEISHNGVKGRPEIEITEQTYNQLKNKNEVMIRVKDGFLSEPWVDDLKLH